MFGLQGHISTQLRASRSFIDENGNTVNVAVDSQGNNLASTIAPIFDQENVQRELQAAVTITQAFSLVAPKAVAEYADSKVNELGVAAQIAHLEGDDKAAMRLLDEAELWDDGGLIV